MNGEGRGVSRRPIGAALFALCIADVSAAAARVSCPRIVVTDEGAVHSLSNARVFRGPVSAGAPLTSVHGTYDLGASRAKDGGAPFNLVCVYNGTTQTQTVEVPSTANMCDVADAGSGTVAGCQ